MERPAGFACAPAARPRVCSGRLAPSACAQRPPAAEFSVGKTVMPADTDYSGALWHGAYVRYLEEARVEYLRWLGVDYGALVRDARVELVVAELALRYREPARLGDRVRVSVAVDDAQRRGVRIPLQSTLVRVHDGATLAHASVVLAPVAADNGRLLRRLPPQVADALRGTPRAAEEGARAAVRNGVVPADVSSAGAEQ